MSLTLISTVFLPFVEGEESVNLAELSCIINGLKVIVLTVSADTLSKGKISPRSLNSVRCSFLHKWYKRARVTVFVCTGIEPAADLLHPSFRGESGFPRVVSALSLLYM